jgi:glycosyltransferase involved in cell wall biosynthesis
MSLFFDSRWIGTHGIGRFAKEIGDRLTHKSLSCKGKPMSPLDPFRLSFQKLPPGGWLLSPGYNAPLLSRTPYLMTVHDLNHIDRTDNSSRLKRIYYSLILKQLLRRARAVLTVSEFSKSRIIEWSRLDSSRVFNVGNGVSEIFRPDGRRYEANGGYILCVSNRRGHKNEEGMLKAFSHARIPASVKLILTGEPTPELLKLAIKLGIGNRLIFSGRVSEDDLAALYRGALFLVFPSFYEGFGLPIVEAFSSGTPVITANVTSMPEIASNAALLVNPSDINDISAAIERLHDSPELRAELVQRGFKRAANFSWDAVAGRIKAAVKAVDTDPAYPLSWS